MLVFVTESEESELAMELELKRLIESELAYIYIYNEPELANSWRLLR